MSSAAYETSRLRRWWRSRISWYVAAAVVVVAIVALLLSVAGGSGSTAGAPAPVGVAPPPATTDHDLSIPVVGPQVNWTSFNGVFVPDGGPRYGPLHVDGSAVFGFADTPRGALVALANAAARRMLAGDDWQKVMMAEVAPGPGADMWGKARTQIQGPVNIPDPMQIVGFKYVLWTPQTAVIDWATRASNGDLQMTTNTVVWQGGDWRLSLQADGSDTPTQVPLSSLDGFVQWGAS